MMAAIPRPCTLYHHHRHHQYILRYNYNHSVTSFNRHVFKAQKAVQPQTSEPSSSPSHPKDSSALPPNTTAASDPDLRAVLELATNSELFEIESILFGPSYLSPLLKSITKGEDFDRFMIEQDFDERQHFIQVLESRFLFLAADARSTLRGWRPTYRNVLLDVRKELKVPCSTKLSTEDLEGEIFIHLLGKCSRDRDNTAAIRVGAAELGSVILKGGQLLSLLKISELVTTRLSGKMLFEAAKHKLDSEVVKKGATGAASKFLGFRSLAAFIGPIHKMLKHSSPFMS